MRSTAAGFCIAHIALRNPKIHPPVDNGVVPVNSSTMKTFTSIVALIFMTTLVHAGSIYDIPVKDIDGKDTTLAAYKGKVVLIVNVASKCGLTPQYKPLEAIHEKYKDKGFAVLGFPCNQFGGQEPGNNEQIKQFCSEKYSISFPLFDKIDVNGPKRHPLCVALAGKDSPYP